MPRKNRRAIVAAGAVVAASLMLAPAASYAATASGQDSHRGGGSAVLTTGAGEDETVTWGDYRAEFHHTGSEGETLEVSDNATGDGYAAVAYVRFSNDSDRFVMDHGYHDYNLRKGDSGEYDVPEVEWVDIMICRGYKSIPGDNCSNWETGWA